MPLSKLRNLVWPTLRTLTIKLRHMPDILIDASVSIDTGKPVVDFRIDGDDEKTLTPAEARRVAAGLMKAAACCDAKTAAAKTRHSTPLIEESAPQQEPPRKQVTKVKIKTKTKTQAGSETTTQPRHATESDCDFCDFYECLTLDDTE